MMVQAATLRSRWSLLHILEGLVLTGFVLYAAKPVLVPLVLAVLFSFVLSPIVATLERLGLARIYAVLLIVCSTFCVLGLIGWATAIQVQNLAGVLPQHKKEIQAKIDSIRGIGGATTELVAMFHELIDAPTETEGDSDSQAPLIVTRPAPESNLARVSSAVLPVLEPLATLGLVIVLVIFILVNREDLRDRIIGLIGRHRLASTTRMLGDTADRLSQYLLTQLFVNATFGLAFATIIWRAGIPFAFLWGLLMALLRFVPYVGTWLAAAPPVLLSVALFTGWWPSLLLLGAFLVLDLITANAVEPLLLGRNTGVTPVALLVAAAFWTWIWGPLGLVLSTPLTVCLVVLGRHVPQFQFLTMLMGGRQAFAPHLGYYQRLLAGDRTEARQRALHYVAEHGLEAAYDHMIIPALRLARRDRSRQELSPQEEEVVYQATRDVLEALAERQPAAREPSPRQPAGQLSPAVHSPQATAGTALAGNGADSESASTEPASALVLGCPAHHVAEELVLKMLEGTLSAAKLRLHAVSSKMLPSSIIDWAEQHAPAVIFIAILPPGGSPQASFLCQSLREHFAQTPIVVGYWGAEKHFDQVLVRMRAAGASYVTTSLLQSRSQIEYLAQAPRSDGER